MGPYTLYPMAHPQYLLSPKYLESEAELDKLFQRKDPCEQDQDQRVWQEPSCDGDVGSLRGAGGCATRHSERQSVCLPFR